MASPSLHPESLPQQAAGLLSCLAEAARGIAQHNDVQGVSNAAVASMRNAAETALLLQFDAASRQLRLISTSLPNDDELALRAAVEARNFDNRPRLGSVGSAFVDRLNGVDRQTASVGELCRELVDGSYVASMSRALGGVQRSCLLLPLTTHAATTGLLCIIADRFASEDQVAARIFAEQLSTALTLARVLDHVQRAARNLTPEHPARFELNSALRVTECSLSEAPRTLVPGDKIAGSYHPASRADHRRRLLLVEDEERLRKSTMALLEGLGYGVVGVSSGEQALSAYARAHEHNERFDLVIMDQTLAGRMNGIETLRILRSVDTTVRAILLSGQATSRSAEEAKKQGFFLCLAKPVSLGQLQSAITSVIA